MNLPDFDKCLSKEKRPLARQLLLSLCELPGVCSVTLVGSFPESPGWTSLSDIDVVVICETLTRSVFESCIKAIETLNPKTLGVPYSKVYINTTFGPLKFPLMDTMIVHLMVYDIAGHRSHVLNSPFTCYDWERSQIYAGKSLREVFPVLGLQPDDFVGGRRGMENYLADLKRGVITYRRYEFDGENPCEVIDAKELDRRQSGEYAFHIVRNTINNYAKMLLGSNLRLEGDALVSFWREHLPSSVEIIPKYQIWEQVKRKKDTDFPEDVVGRVQEFLALFSRDFLGSLGGPLTRRIVVMRHAKTVMNDGSFLGQRRDPDVLGRISPWPVSFAKVYSSPLKRAFNTARQLQPEAIILSDSRLLEEDYGVAEGMTYPQLAARYPNLLAAWGRGEDPCFPDGENTAMVEERGFSFLDDLRQSCHFPILVVTHNVVVRCWLGRMLGIPKEDWYKLKTKHLIPFEILVADTKYIFNLTTQQRECLGRNLSAYA